MACCPRSGPVFLCMPLDYSCSSFQWTWLLMSPSPPLLIDHQIHRDKNNYFFLFLEPRPVLGTWAQIKPDRISLLLTSISTRHFWATAHSCPGKDQVISKQCDNTVKQESPLVQDRNSCVPKYVLKWKVTEFKWLASRAQAHSVTDRLLWIPSLLCSHKTNLV